MDKQAKQRLQNLITWPKMFLSFTDRNIGKRYDLMGPYGPFTTDSRMPLMNMGYWKEANPDDCQGLEQATRSLFDLVCSNGEISTTDDWVIDVGCGYGTNVIHCAHNFGAKRVVGLTLSTVQLNTGQKLITTAGLQDRVTLLKTSATQLPLPTNSINKVLSVEAALHFNLREDFFHEAYRVLKPGGLLSLADMVAPPPRNLAEQALLQYLIVALQMPLANIYSRAKYVAKLKQAGFEIVEQESIYQHVFPPYQRWFWHKFVNFHEPKKILLATASPGYFAYPWDYLRVKARKPK